jgi:hypothetical protein
LEAIDTPRGYVRPTEVKEEDTVGVGTGQKNGQGFDVLQFRRIDGLQGFQQGIETIRHFGELGLSYLQPYSMAQGPYLLFGQVLHVRLLSVIPRSPLPARQVRV